MILFSIRELENLLIEGKISDKLIFNYLFIQIILLTLGGYLPLYEDFSPWAIWVHLIISLVAIFWGVRKTYDINREGDNRDYFKRFISLSFVAGIRTIVFSLIFILILNVGERVIEEITTSSAKYVLWKNIFDLIGYVIFNVIYFYILITSFKRISSSSLCTVKPERA